jgi:hypothetical protein
MQDEDVAAHLPTRQARAIEGRSMPLKVTGKLRHAIEAMVWRGARRTEAAELAGLKDHSLRAALKKPHVIGFYRRELEVLRESERARNIHALTRVRDSDDNKMATVAAVKALEQISESEVDRASSGRARAPGFVIIIPENMRPAGPLLEGGIVGSGGAERVEVEEIAPNAVDRADISSAPGDH